MAIEDKVYESAVRGRQDFRQALRVCRKECDDLRSLLKIARRAIVDWSTGVNTELLAKIDAATKD